MSFNYKLRCTIFGHKNDVRSLSSLNFPEGSFVSGSRDVTARVWVTNEEDQGYREGIVFGGHNGFVSAVCVLPPDEEFPQGLIMTGSNDKAIHAYTLESPQPVYRLEGHSDNVCSLFAGKFGTLISGSWDSTARVWLKKKCFMILKSHEAAVWGVAIMPVSGYMLTGSADKTIKLWKAGKCEYSFVGHTDCVRDVVVMNDTEFLSCSNDFTIRQWSTTSRSCLHIYSGHSSFVYKLAVMLNGVDFVSCGEDRTVRVWSGGELKQTIVHPAQSVWSVCVLPNGDIVSGGSDAAVRVFTTDSNRVAPDAELQAYEEQLSVSEIPAQIGDIKTEDLVGPQALLEPGKRDGQTMMVRTATSIEAHQWSQSEQRWIKIGNVTGGTSDSQTSSSGAKTHYQGKDYDYVFSVEIYEDKPPLKLPYNIGEDPWVAAHNFLENNNISQMFLDQVANFIQQQTGSITLGADQAPVISDPFTGGSRYVPASAASGTSSSLQSVDPFTGTGRYVPGGAPALPVAVAAATPNYFPETNYIFFDQCKPQPIFDKLRQLNSTAVQGNQCLSADEIQSLEDLVNGRTKPTPASLEILWRAMQWSPDLLLPVLDILRLVLRDQTANDLFSKATESSQRFIGYACSVLKSDAGAAQIKNHLVMIRVLCNMFHHACGEKLILETGERLMAMANATMQHSTDKNLQVACVSFLLNLIIGYCRLSSADCKNRSLLVAIDWTRILTDPEAQFRLVVAIGTGVVGSPQLVALVKSLNISNFLATCQKSDVDRLKHSAQKLQNILSN